MPGRDPRNSGQAPILGGLDSSANQPIAAIGELRLLRAQDDLAKRLSEVGDPDKAVRLGVRFAATLLRADHQCVALLEPGRAEAVIEFTGVGEPGADSWPAAVLAEFARGLKPELARGIAVSRLRRRRRAWGTLALRWTNSDPDWGVRNDLTRLTAIVNEAVERIESRRLLEVRSRIDRKILEQLRPKDLLYQILDGLRSLTGYDHSGVILLRVEGSPTLEIVTEQLAFRKARSSRIGARTTIPVSPGGLHASLLNGKVCGYWQDGSSWKPWSPDAPAEVAEWLVRSMPPSAPDAPPMAELIVAPLVGPDGLAGILAISARHHGTFGLYEAELLESFLPHAMMALQNARRAESLEDQVIRAERKHAMADLARGVSHDINNALGSILPLVQQLRDEVDSQRITPATLKTDLAQIETSLRTCTRIFAGMLQFARRAAHDSVTAEARIDASLDGALAILGEGLRRHGIHLARDIEPGLPGLPLRQTELDQVMLNLISNGRDAIVAAGNNGVLTVGARRTAGRDARPIVRVEVRDDGIGIPHNHLARVLEPFFTTKPTGNGLGLSICRSIIWQCQGRIAVESPAPLPGTAHSRHPPTALSPSRPGAAIIIEFPLTSTSIPSGLTTPAAAADPA